MPAWHSRPSRVTATRPTRVWVCRLAGCWNLAQPGAGRLGPSGRMDPAHPGLAVPVDWVKYFGPPGNNACEA